MAFNIPDTYQNTTPAEPLDQKTLNKMVWRSLFLQASFNYERMQAAGWPKEHKECLCSAHMVCAREALLANTFFVTVCIGRHARSSVRRYGSRRTY